MWKNVFYMLCVITHVVLYVQNKYRLFVECWLKTRFISRVNMERNTLMSGKVNLTPSFNKLSVSCRLKQLKRASVENNYATMSSF